MIPIILFGSLAILLVLNVPIAVALGLATTFALLQSGLPLLVVIQRMVTSNDSFPLLAIPFFMLAGSIMTYGGVSKRLVAFADALVGWLTGGLGIVSNVSGMFFSAISGSSAATTAAVGSVMFPEMEKRGYDRSFSAAIIAAAGETGIIIPPSVPMVVYGVIAGVSIGDMFLGGFGPGILMGTTMAVLVYFVSRRHGYKGSSFGGLRKLGKSFLDALWGILMPVIILGGIYGGIFTPTEAAAFASLYGVLIGFFVYKDLKVSHFSKIMQSTIVSTAVVMFIMNSAGLFGWLIAREQIPDAFARFFVSISSNPTVFLMLVNVLLLFTGIFLNASAAITILAPILVPVAIQLGIDPVFFGVIVVCNLAIGCLTPPVGVDLFVASTISGVSMARLSRAIVPFLVVLIVDLVVLTYVPAITMWLPNLMR